MTKDETGNIHVMFFVLYDRYTSTIVPDLYLVVHTEILLPWLP